MSPLSSWMDAVVRVSDNMVINDMVVSVILSRELQLLDQVTHEPVIVSMLLEVEMSLALDIDLDSV